MLLKLLKYDIKSTAAKMLTAFAVFAFICIVIPPIIKLFQEDAAMTYLIFTVPVGAIALSIVTFIFIFQRYNSGLYGNEGSLMFTLPVKGRYLLISKFITAFMWTILGCVLGFASICTIVYVSLSFDEIRKGINFLDLLDVWNISTLLLIITLIIVTTVQFIIQVYFLITISKLPIWRKFGVLVGILTYLAVDYIDSILEMCLSPVHVGKFKVEGLAALRAVTGKFIWRVQLIPILISLVLSVGMFIATTVLIEKKTSLK